MVRQAKHLSTEVRQLIDSATSVQSCKIQQARLSEMKRMTQQQKVHLTCTEHVSLFCPDVPAVAMYPATTNRWKFCQDICASFCAGLTKKLTKRIICVCAETKRQLVGADVPIKIGHKYNRSQGKHKFLFIRKSYYTKNLQILNNGKSLVNMTSACICACQVDQVRHHDLKTISINYLYLVITLLFNIFTNSGQKF